ncbi:MAG: hypothetical protein ACK4XY_08565 [Chloroherpetonaceae bacterium]
MNQLLLLTTLLLIAKSLLAQPQPQGEFHQQLFKKSGKRAKASPEIGVVVFAAQEIPRLGTVKEIEPMLGNEFRRYQSVWARFFLPKHLGALPDGMPKRIIYRMIVEGKLHYEKELTDDYLPLPEWSSWMIQLPDALQEGYDTLPPEPVRLRLEVWASKSLTKDGAEKLIAVGECLLQP